MTNSSCAQDSEREDLPGRYPRVNIVVEPSLYGTMQTLAAESGISLSSLAKSLIQEALEIREDVALAALAEEREKDLTKSPGLLTIANG